MLCPKCGYYSERDESVCPECGQILNRPSDLRQGGVQALRQGKRAIEAVRTKQQVPAVPEAARHVRITTRHETAEMPVVRDTRGELAEESSMDLPGASREAAPSFERRRRTVYDEEADEITAMKYLAAHEGSGSVSRLVNWVKISIIAILAGIMLLAGGWFFLEKTNAGQRLLVRLGKDANSVAL